MSRKLVIIGGVAGGATAAARARRLDEDAEIIMIERGEYVSFANCGLPYHIGGEIRKRARLLVQTRHGLARRFALDIRTRQEAIRIDPAARLVHIRDLETGREYAETYDNLLLSPGAAPFVPPVPGNDHPRVLTLRNMADMDRIKKFVDREAKSALVIGGGFIGLEMAENLRRRELAVSLVELAPQVMPPLDAEIAARLHRELQTHGIELHLNDAVTRFDDDGGSVRAQLKSGRTLQADLAIMAVGVRPDTALARTAGLAVDERGALLVDDHLRTSDPHIYAVGDAIQVQDVVSGTPAFVPLAGPANRQARIAVDNIFGRVSRYRGTQGTSIVQLFDVTAALTGASEKTLRRLDLPYRKVYVFRGHHVGYYPGAEEMMIKLLFTPEEGRVLGAQIIGGAGVDKRIDVLAVAVQAGLTVADLEEMELAYAPQFGAAKDPVNIAGFVARNALSGDEDYVFAEELGPEAAERFTIIDVRDPVEYAAGTIPGARLLPLSELRERWREIPNGKPVLTFCTVGQRAYYANRMLRQKGLQVRNLAGGFNTYNLVRAAQTSSVPPAETPPPCSVAPGEA
ncbi:MAG: FAD-dependent oxidoreductase [Phycisphaerae bacterium]|jgi:NADPH-dependent 2,4-dienoyl-CoA reductase/sulfur reductase-like enzyme/rhodanese-related sulfurtransferase